MMTRAAKREASPMPPHGRLWKRNRKELAPKIDSDSNDSNDEFSAQFDNDTDEVEESDTGSDEGEDSGDDDDSCDVSDHAEADSEKLSPEDEKMAVFLCCTPTLSPIWNIRPYWNRGMVKDELQHCQWLFQGIKKRFGSFPPGHPFCLDPKLAKDIEANMLWIITQLESSEHLAVVDYLKPCYQWDGDSRISTWLKTVRPSVNNLPPKMRSGRRSIV
ncbi:hypothetical protein HDK90DRAFT_548974 [Phyllosticta capitalensis]|uniref:Uncharacterized protein n=1 Tax=Phyllosticta capitalensis TaxID=121624 RepID=A0ABR1YWN7_9PEZI